MQTTKQRIKAFSVRAHKVGYTYEVVCHTYEGPGRNVCLYPYKLAAHEYLFKEQYYAYLKQFYVLCECTNFDTSERLSRTKRFEKSITRIQITVWSKVHFYCIYSMTWGTNHFQYLPPFLWPLSLIFSSLRTTYRQKVGVSIPLLFAN